MRYLFLAACLATGLAACGSGTQVMSSTMAAPATNMAAQPQVRQPTTSLLDRVGLWWDFFFDKPLDTVPLTQIPVRTLTREALMAAPDGSPYRLGHSTVLMKLRGKFWLTDPVFSERSSPAQWFGPKRFHAPPIAIEDLPPLEAVILSHDHYDHLDHQSILQLREKTAHFIAPRGVGDILVGWGVDAAKVQQFDWWQYTEVSGLRLVATPAQHFSGRAPWNGNRTLWSSWVILDGERRIFYGGDSGYFDGFKDIGERFGPFDITLLEAGAYDNRWTDIHMLPEQAVQAHQDLRGRWLLPIHNGTFDLAFHSWNQPFERVLQAAHLHGVQVTTPIMGEQIDLQNVLPGSAWWRTTDAGSPL